MNDVIGNFLVLGHFRRLVVPLFDVAAWGLLGLKLRINDIAMVAAADIALVLSRAGVLPSPDLWRHISVLGFPASVSKVGKADDDRRHQNVVIGYWARSLF